MAFASRGRDFAQAAQMARRRTKLGCKKRLDEIPGDCWANGPAAHAKNIHVIVLDTLLGGKVVVN